MNPTLVMRLLIFATLLVCDMEALTSRFKSVKCVSLNESIIFHNCYLRPYSRNYSTVNFAFTHELPFVSPLMASIGGDCRRLEFLMNSHCLQFDILIKYRYGTIFRQIFHTEVDWCDIIGQVSGNKVAMKIAELLKDSVPRLFRQCPLAPVKFSI